MDFYPRIAESKSGRKLNYREEFCFSRVPESSFFNCWAIGYCEWGNQYSTNLAHNKAWISLEFVTEGSFRITKHPNSLTLQAGDVFFLHTSNKYGMHATPGGKKYSLYFQSDVTARLIKQKIFMNYEVMRAQDPQELEQLYRNIYQAASEGDPAFDMHVFKLLENLNHWNNGLVYPQPLNKALTYLIRTSDWWCPREKLASISGVSISTLNRLFQKYLDCSIGEYCQNQRIEQACNLLQLPGVTIKEVANECGFSTESFFCHMFKKVKNCTPSEFIKSKS